MTYACSYDVPGDENIYAKVKAEIGEGRPRGMIVQLVSKVDTGGLRHIQVWESREEFDRFQRAHVDPAVARVLAGMGITEAVPRPTVTDLDLVDVTTD